MKVRRSPAAGGYLSLAMPPCKREAAPEFLRNEFCATMKAWAQRAVQRSPGFQNSPTSLSIPAPKQSGNAPSKSSAAKSLRGTGCKRRFLFLANPLPSSIRRLAMPLNSARSSRSWAGSTTECSASGCAFSGCIAGSEPLPTTAGPCVFQAAGIPREYPCCTLPALFRSRVSNFSST